MAMILFFSEYNSPANWDDFPALKLSVTGHRDQLPAATQLLLHYFPFRLQTFDPKFQEKYPHLQRHVTAGSGFFNVGDGTVQCIYCGLRTAADNYERTLLELHDSTRRFCPSAYGRLLEAKRNWSPQEKAAYWHGRASRRPRTVSARVRHDSAPRGAPSPAQSQAEHDAAGQDPRTSGHRTVTEQHWRSREVEDRSRDSFSRSQQERRRRQRSQQRRKNSQQQPSRFPAAPERP